MVCRFLLIFFACFFTASGLSLAQSNATISGYVRDQSSGETLIGAVVRVGDHSVSTNNYGFFSLSLPPGDHVVSVSYVGFVTLEKQITLESTLQINFDLLSKDQQIDEIVVTGTRRDQNVRSPQMGLNKLAMEEIRNVPVVFGERDLLKTIQLLPGVASGNEGSTNFYVRGGASDQNLVILDEAIVYNPSHLLGFFSTFNSDAVKDVGLYKGGIPAQYGGRISSVMDINMLDGNRREYVVEGGLGLIASRVKVEGPIQKDKSSFMVSGRRTYADLFLKLSNNEDARKSNLYFYDLNAKANFQINERNTVYVSGYFGKDDLGYSDLFSFDWGNATTTLRWNSIINERLFSNTSLIYSDFTYNVAVTSDNSNFTIASKIRNWNLKQDFSYYSGNRHTFRFGLNVLDQNVRPASIDAEEDAGVNPIAIEQRRGLEAAAYVSHEWKPNDALSVVYGIRLTDFMVRGGGTFYDFDEEGEVIGERYYGGGIIKHYFNLEPRLSMSYMLASSNSIKASFNRITQNLHQLTNTTSSLPTDQYVVSSLNIKPQIADQVAMGYFQNFANNGYEFSTEVYYKYMDNQIDFRNGAELQANRYLEGELLFGKGRAYGVEWLLKKNSGRLNGWIGYTLSRSERQFEQINDGNWFKARQDRMHDLSVVGMYQLSKKWTLGATWVFNTGMAVTFPSAKYQIGGETRFYYTERNGYRMPDYHRLDLSMVYDPMKKNGRFNSSWAFGIYNVYNRKNAYIVDFRENAQNPNVTEAYQIALFGIIPSVTWNFRF